MDRRRVYYNELVSYLTFIFDSIFNSFFIPSAIRYFKIINIYLTFEWIRDEVGSFDLEIKSNIIDMVLH